MRPALAKVVLTSTVLLAGCRLGSAPTGQVLARVEGHDVTLQDVEAEARGADLRLTAQNAPAMLDRVVSRQLLADEAHKDRLDVTPEAPGDLTRLIQNWRAQKIVARLIVGLAKPTPEQVQAYIKGHPSQLAERKEYLVESISVQTSPSLNATLQSYQDFTAVGDFLKRLGLHTTRTQGVLDTAQLTASFAQRLAQTPDDKLVIASAPGRTLLSRIISRQARPIVGDQAVALARSQLEQQAVSDRVQAEVRRLKRTAVVVYQQGHSPSPTLKAG